MSTTIKLEMETKEALDDFREHSRESYDKVVRKLLYIARIAKKEPRLSKKTVLEIEEARKRIKAGQFYTLEEVKKELGL